LATAPNLARVILAADHHLEGEKERAKRRTSFEPSWADHQDWRRQGAIGPRDSTQGGSLEGHIHATKDPGPDDGAGVFTLTSGSGVRHPQRTPTRKAPVDTQTLAARTTSGRWNSSETAPPSPPKLPDRRTEAALWGARLLSGTPRSQHGRCGAGRIVGCARLPSGVGRMGRVRKVPEHPLKLHQGRVKRPPHTPGPLIGSMKRAW
jgi:hypothetical protein